MILFLAFWVIQDFVDIGLVLRAVHLAINRNVTNIPFISYIIFSHLIDKVELFVTYILFAALISKAAILGIAVGGLVILLMILVAVCRPHSPPVFKDVSVSKPGNASARSFAQQINSFLSCQVQY